MVKNAVANAWVLTIGESNRRWSNQPFDLQAPTPPTIAGGPGSPTSTSIQARVTVASVDNRTGIRDYLWEVTDDPEGLWTVVGFFGVSQSVAGITIQNLNPATTYSVRARGRDGSIAGNISNPSNVVQQATGGVVGVTSWYPNWPIMNVTVLQGQITSTLLDPTQYDVLADKDVVVFQSTYPNITRLNNRFNAINDIRALRTDAQPRAPRFLSYWMFQETQRTLLTSDSDARQLMGELIRDPVEGNPNWFVHRVNQPTDAGWVGTAFDPLVFIQCNMAVLEAGLNSLGENYFEAAWRRVFEMHNLDGGDFLSVLDGWFIDNYHARPATVFQTDGVTPATDSDYDADGVAEVRNDYSAAANAGGRMWSEGHLEMLRVMREYWPDFLLLPNSAKWHFDYLDGSPDPPPLPMSGHPYYRDWPHNLAENISNALGVFRRTSAYEFTGGGSINNCSRSYETAEKFTCPDNESLTGRGAVWMHFLLVDRTPIQNDYTVARFYSGVCMLYERAAICLQRNGNRPFQLDETLLELGAPVGTRTMGTINESQPFASFGLKAANQTNGVARFYWSIFQLGGVFVRTDPPPTGLGNYPGGVAATLTLPAPPSGMKWQRINAANYTNPRTNRSMRNQSPLVNNGTDTGPTISLLPYQALWLRLVPV